MSDRHDSRQADASFNADEIAALETIVGEWLGDNHGVLEDGGHGDVASLAVRILRVVRSR